MSKNKHKTFDFDYTNLTLDGKPMTSDDVALIIYKYHYKHPKDALWKHIVDVIVGSNYTQEFKRE